MSRTGTPAADPVDARPLTELSARRLGPVRRYFARHPVAMDALIMVLFGVPALLTAQVDAAPPPLGVAPHPLVAPALAAAGTAALFWRRRRPATVTAVMTGLGVVALGVVGSTGGFEVGLMYALYAVAAAHRPRTTWLLFCLATAAFGGAAWLWEQQGLDVADGDVQLTVSRDVIRITTVSVTAGMNLLAVAVGTSVRNRRSHVADLVARTQDLARERDRLAQLARSAERTRIAREMHDVVAHSISVMIALSDGGAAAIDRAPERAHTAIDELARTGRRALGDMRRVLGVLDPEGGPCADAEHTEDVGAVVDRFRTAGLPVRLVSSLPPGAVEGDAGRQLAVRRIVSEALTNALRHAPGTPQVRVALRSEGGALVVEVVVAGPTRAVVDAGGAGHGLIGMRERAELLGGYVEAGPSGTGWRVRAVLPWPDVEEGT